MADFSRPNCYYKYRSLENLERFLSIIIDHKLYGALYSEMNDPMEGYYQYNPTFDHTIIDNIVSGKQKTYICALSRSGNIGLMWTHYADENRGCCLEVEVTSKTWRKIDVDYSEYMPELTLRTTVDDILRVKAKMWEYEQEIRYLSPNTPKGKDRPQLTVKMKRILVGCNVDRTRYTHLCKIIKALDKDIEVYKMKKSDLDYGFVY